jgi:hypothetical protein
MKMEYKKQSKQDYRIYFRKNGQPINLDILCDFITEMGCEIIRTEHYNQID